MVLIEGWGIDTVAITLSGAAVLVRGHSDKQETQWLPLPSGLLVFIYIFSAVPGPHSADLSSVFQAPQLIGETQ